MLWWPVDSHLESGAAKSLPLHDHRTWPGIAEERYKGDPALPFSEEAVGQDHSEDGGRPPWSLGYGGQCRQSKPAAQAQDLVHA
jgi:hypothetical protein